MSVRFSPAAFGLLTGAIMLASLPAQAAMGPAGTFVNSTDLALVLTFNGTQVPGHSFHIVESSKPGPVPAGPGTPAENLANELIVLEPGQSVSLMQDFAGAAGAFAMAEFSFEVPCGADGAMLPAKVTYSFDYPGKVAPESRDRILGGSVSMNVIYPESPEWTSRYVFEPMPGRMTLKKAAEAPAAWRDEPLPASVLAESRAAAPWRDEPLPPGLLIASLAEVRRRRLGDDAKGDGWFREYRGQAAQPENQAARALREWQERNANNRPEGKDQ